MKAAKQPPCTLHHSRDNARLYSTRSQHNQSSTGISSPVLRMPLSGWPRKNAGAPRGKPASLALQQTALQAIPTDSCTNLVEFGVDYGQ